MRLPYFLCEKTGEKGLTFARAYVIIKRKGGENMRRKSDKEVRKEFSIFLILGIIAVLSGIFVLLFPVLPTTPYEEYKEKYVLP